MICNPFALLSSSTPCSDEPRLRVRQALTLPRTKQTGMALDRTPPDEPWELTGVLALLIPEC
jgi:hypothetical protein